MTRRFAAMVALLCAAQSTQAATPEVELGLALAHDVTDSNGISAPAVGLRVGADLGNFTPSLRALAVVGPEGRNYVSDGYQPDPSGLQAWQALGELRAHTNGHRLQFHLAAAAGVGKVLALQCSCTERLASQGKLGFSWALSAGARALLNDSFWLGAEASLAGWTQVYSSVGRGAQVLSPDPRALPVILVSLSLGFRLGRP